ncbi:MAG: glycogen synthase GlgA [Oscillospiraceae bacterium]|nr:glycogen synthase GlgA [Oscillospiraceae bacterium]
MKTKTNGKKILFVSGEAAPFITTGGLGEVVGALPRGLYKVGGSAKVCVVLPLYGEIAAKFGGELNFLANTYVDLGWRHQYCGIFTAKAGEITYYFIDNEYYFKRAGCYGFFDDGERFAFFCKAVLDVLGVIGFIPDIIHAHDWQAALVPVYLAASYSGREEFKDIKTVFTIHNMKYQGKYSMDILEDIFDISYSHRHILEFDGDINLMKGAIVCAGRVSTVSPAYAGEIHDPNFACGLAPVVNLETNKIRGILNGIDTASYDPAADPKIFCKYDSGSIEKKLENKICLQKETGLQKNKDIPVIAMITRLTEQKGLDLVLEAINEIMALPLQFVIMGGGDKKYEQSFEQLAAQFPEKMSAYIGFDPDLARRIYAGADMFLMPSKFEPCGLGQMMAARYGAVPIVRETGGLKDSILPYDQTNESGNGFLFADYSSKALMEALWEALAVFGDGRNWAALTKRAMESDFGWERSAGEYMKMYEELIGEK